MKPAPFAYVAPRSLAEVLGALACADDDTKLLAGGQSLIPLLNMRLATPARLIDLGRVSELAYVEARTQQHPTGRSEADAPGYAIGAMTRQRALERDPRILRDVPLLAEAVGFVGHPQIRNRGTVGGSIAHGDPAAELPAVAVCLDARVTIQGPRGSRSVPASSLYLGYLATTLAPDELLTEVWFPSSPPHTGSAWLEFARRHGDYAIAGVGVTVTLAGSADRSATPGRTETNSALGAGVGTEISVGAGVDAADGGTIVAASIVAMGVGGVPVRATVAATSLVGARIDAAGRPESDAVRAAVAASRAATDPADDVQATAAYRRHLVGVLLERALPVACQRARTGSLVVSGWQEASA
jgi:carbon-monoxide dehydrogenase medium subunit